MDLISFVIAQEGVFDRALFCRLLGAANTFREGDAAAGVAAADDVERQAARGMLAETRIGDLCDHPVHEDELSAFADAAVDAGVLEGIRGWTLGALRSFLLHEPEAVVRGIMPGLPSDVIACVVKLMPDDELVAVSSKIFNPLPGSRVGARGYLGARVQPNSPTDHPDDIRWQVFNAFSYATGDVLLGTNPVSSDVDSVLAVERVLSDIVDTFGLTGVLPHCVLAHIDVQAEAERRAPGSTALWFQSLAGVEDAAVTFGTGTAALRAHAATRTGRFGLYFETGQGADATNGHAKGFDMLMHESRKYGLARALARDVAAARAAAGHEQAPWVHVNDVAGFIGPEVFRTREQLARCCLEDLVMGKLHGLTIGLDVCTTLHMDVTLDDLDWCLDRVMPANPAYLMALPTRSDPMLSYLTTSYHDHVRLRERFGFRVDDRMWAFYVELGAVLQDGAPGPNYGNPAAIYAAYCRRRGDVRTDAEIADDAVLQMAAVRARGVLIAEGHGDHHSAPPASLDLLVRQRYDDARMCVRAVLPVAFAERLAGSVMIHTRSRDRTDYILHPPSGEELAGDAAAVLGALAIDGADVQVVVSDGLNALALTDEGHLEPFLATLTAELCSAGFTMSPHTLVMFNGRVRAGYRIGELLFGGDAAGRLAEVGAGARTRSVVHVIGERPGSGHRAFSAYITGAPDAVWSARGTVDHHMTRVVSGIADTALEPAAAAAETVRLLCQLVGRPSARAAAASTLLT